MKPRRLCWLGLITGLVLLLALPVLWVAIVLVAPTEWARSHVVAALQQGTGRSVQLDELDVCFTGGIALGNLRIGAPGAASDPWLQAERVEIDVSPFQLLRGRFEPSRMEIEGATLRVLRRANGSLELLEPLSTATASPGASTGEASAEPHVCGAVKLKARLRRVNVVVIDEPSKSLMNFEQVDGEGDLETDGSFRVTMSGLWNQGPFQLTAHVDESDGSHGFDGQFRSSDVNMDQGMTAIRYAVPLLAGTPVALNGKMGTNVYLSGRGRSWPELSRSLVGHGTLSLDPIALNGTPLVAEFARISSQPMEGAVGSIRTDFNIKEGRIITENLSMMLGRLPVTVSGWTAFNGALDYQVRLDSLTDRLPEKALRYMSNLDLDVKHLAALRLSGTVDKVAIRPYGPSAQGRAAIDQMLAPEDRQRLKVLGRQLRDKLVR